MQLIRTKKTGEILEGVIVGVDEIIKRLVTLYQFHYMASYDLSNFSIFVKGQEIRFVGENTDWKITGSLEESAKVCEFLYWHQLFFERVANKPHALQIENSPFIQRVSLQDLAAKKLVFNFFAPKIKSKFVLANLCVLIVGNVLNFELISRMISDPLATFYSERIEKVITVVNECEGDSEKVAERLGIVTRNRIAERELAVSAFAG